MAVGVEKFDEVGRIPCDAGIDAEERIETAAGYDGADGDEISGQREPVEPSGIGGGRAADLGDGRYNEQNGSRNKT